MEKKDVETLDDPQNSILAKGGKIFMAIENGKPVGCVAMIKMADGGYEVAKMTVEETYRGRGLGKKLLQACIDAARMDGAPRLYLESNSSLTPALKLYKSMGFQEIPSQSTVYSRCDVWMELKL